MLHSLPTGTIINYISICHLISLHLSYNIIPGTKDKQTDLLAQQKSVKHMFC